MNTPSSASVDRTPSSADEARQSQKIVIVDSDEGSRSVLAVALGREGFEAVSVSSSAEAMRLLSPSAPMPEMMVVASQLREEDGFSLVAQLRGDRRTGSIPVLMLAKGDEPQFHQLSRLVGADEILLKPVFARDVALLARVQLCPVGKDGGRVLDCESSPVAHFLRAMLATTRSGVIELEGGRGHIAFRRGRVIDAAFDGLHGINGLVRSLALARGSYKIIARNLAFDAAFPCTLDELATIVFPRLQRWEELLLRSLPLDVRLGLDFAALTKALPSMPDAVNPVVRLFDGLRDVREVLMDSPLDETITLEIATRLFLMGIVVPVKPDDNTGIAKGDPRLFEPKPTEAVERMERLFAPNPIPAIASAQLPSSDDDWDQVTDWAVTRAVEVESGHHLAAEVQQQLNAFNIKPVVEPQSAPFFSADLMEFTIGESIAERPMEVALSAPIPLVDVAKPVPVVESSLVVLQHSVQALESEFFQIEETPGLESPRLAAQLPEYAPVESNRVGAVGWTVIGMVLVAAASITAWQLSANQEPPSPPVAEVVPAPIAEKQPQPIHLETAAETVAEPVIEPLVAAVAPDSAAVLATATRLYDQGKLSEAKVALEALIESDSSNTNAWMLLGLARFDSRDIVGAEEAANTVLAIDPKMARAYLLRATILIDARKRAEAAAEIQHYLDLEPHGPFAGEAKALLKI